MSCTRCLDLTELRLGSAWDEPTPGRLPFVMPGSPRRHGRDRSVDLVHSVLEIDVDFEAKSLEGVVTHHLRPLRPSVDALVLDAVEMDVREVRLDGRTVSFRHDGLRLRVRLDEPLSEGEESRLSVSYACRPRRGFYFLGPDERRPDRPVHAWSQGQDEDSRYWWPVHDDPGEKTSSEMIATVPAGFTAVSNGRLQEVREHGDRRTFHWRQDEPHSPYLVTLAVGPFESFEQHCGELPMTTWCLPGRLEEARRVVAETPAMVELFSRRTGVPYPWEKYDQVFVEDFIFGGMENTSATTLTDLVLHDERAALDYTAENLVSHELAHQWWGNLVTCRDWSQAWLNEGFATFFELVWKEHAKGEDEAWVLRRELKEGYLAEESGSYRRPIVCRRYEDPIELFDAHLYQKGAWVVFMLRDLLGEELFWRSLQRYLEQHRGGSVETSDLRRAVEASTGRNVDAFFEQWVESAGHPELKARADWDAAESEWTVEIEQVQEGEDIPEAFQLSVELGFLAGGEWRLESFDVERRRQSFVLSLPEEPEAWALDPRERLPCPVEQSRSPLALVQLLEGAPWAPARAAAARELGRDASHRAVESLARALERDEVWAVRASAAEALGKAGTSDALEALIARLDERHPKARRALVKALGEIRRPAAAEALAGVVRKGDPSYFVEANAARALGRTRCDGSVDELLEALGRPERTWNETVRCGVLSGLGEVAFADRERAIEALLPWTERDRFVQCRRAALQSLARIGRGSEAARERLEELLEDDEFRVVMGAARALGVLGRRRSSSALRRLSERALDGRVRRAARESLRRLDHGDEGLAARVRDEVEELRSTQRRLRDRIERLERRGEDAVP